MLGIGKTLEEAVGGAQGGEAHFRAVDEWREPFVMALTGFAEEHGLDGAAGTQRFFDKADAFDAHKAAFRGQSAAQGHAKFLEPAIVAAGEERGLACRPGVVARHFARTCHSLEVNKFGVKNAKKSELLLWCRGSEFANERTMRSAKIASMNDRLNRELLLSFIRGGSGLVLLLSLVVVLLALWFGWSQRSSFGDALALTSFYVSFGWANISVLRWIRGIRGWEGSASRLLVGPRPEDPDELLVWQRGRHLRYSFLAMVLTMTVFLITKWLKGEC